MGPSIAERSTLRGRAREQEAVAALVAGAAAARGGGLVLHGEPGSGRTALVTYAAAEAAGFTVLVTSGNEAESALACAGLHRLVRPVMHLARSLPAGPARILCQALEWGRCANGERFALSAAVLELLCAAAIAQPVLCCVDDAQWLDEPSLDALSFAARRLRTERVAILFTGREECGLIQGVPSLRLDPLDQRASCELLADLVPDGLAGDVAGVLATVAGGNPGALVDLARSLTPEQRRGEAAPPCSLPPDSTFRRAYQMRLSRLPADTRWLLLLAAADPELDVGGLIRAAVASGVDIDSLEPAEAARLIRVSGGEVEFPQPLVRSIVYDDATLAQRRAAHRLLARTLDPRAQRLRRALHLASVADGPDDRLAAELDGAATAHRSDRATASLALARAAELSMDPVAAGHRLVAAARHAWAAGEPHRARMLLRRVRATAVPHHLNAQSELLLGEIELRAGATAHARQTLLAAAHDLEQDRLLAVSAMMRAGEALCLAGDYDRYAEVARRALALRCASEPLGAELMFEHFSGLTEMFAGNYGRAAAPLRRVLTLAPVLDDATALARASVAGILLGDDAQAHRLAVRSATVARSTGDLSTVPYALELAAAAEFALGRYESATSALLDGLRLARASGQDSLASVHLATLATLAAVVGDRETCLIRVREARGHPTSHGVSRSEAMTAWALGVLDLVGGRPAEAVARLRALATDRPGHGQLVIQVAATPHLVEAAVRAGARTAAGSALTVFDRWARSTGNPAWLALSARCHALVAECEGEAEEYFREALRQHIAGDSQFERARTELLFGQELRRFRRPGAAREHLRSALETFRRFDARPWIDQATAELRAAGDQVEHRSVAVTEALTPQQMQIARLAAAGATNREVATQLFLSTRTVDYHMRNIFTRLGIRSRIDLTKLIS